MNSPLLIGFGAGLVSGVLFASAATGSLLAMLLFYLAPMPAFLAGLGWGWMAAVYAGLAGTIMTTAAIGPLPGLGFLATLGLPVAILSYLALLARPVPAGAPDPAIPAGGGPALEWYPAGRLVAWAAIMAGVLAAASVPMLGMDADTYRATIQDVVDNAILKQLDPSTTQNLERTEIEAMVAVLARALPAASAIIWLAVAVFNMWAAGRIVDLSGQALRPWPDLGAMTFPKTIAFGFVAALTVSFLPGLVGIIATAFVGAFLLAYTVLGLIIVHAITRPMPLRPILLATVYLGIVLFGWVALILAVIGIGDPVFRLRERMAANLPPPPRLGGPDQ